MLCLAERARHKLKDCLTFPDGFAHLGQLLTFGILKPATYRRRDREIRVRREHDFAAIQAGTGHMATLNRRCSKSQTLLGIGSKNERIELLFLGRLRILRGWLRL